MWEDMTQGVATKNGGDNTNESTGGATDLSAWGKLVREGTNRRCSSGGGKRKIQRTVARITLIVLDLHSPISG